MYPPTRRSFLASLALPLSACRPKPRAGLDTVFSDFDYVGEFSLSDLSLKTHPHRITHLPPSWIPAIQYVFHLDRDCDFEPLATNVIPSRLRSVGATVLYAPLSWRDMAYPNMGNPIWEIEFKKDRYHGRIKNRVDIERYGPLISSSRIHKKFADPRIDDYILTFE